MEIDLKRPVANPIAESKLAIAIGSEIPTNSGGIFPLLAHGLTPKAPTVDVTYEIDNPVVSGNFEGFNVGDSVKGSGIPDGTTILERDIATVTLSAAPTKAGKATWTAALPAGKDVVLGGIKIEYVPLNGPDGTILTVYVYRVVNNGAAIAPDLPSELIGSFEIPMDQALSAARVPRS